MSYPSIDERLRDLNIVLPPAGPARGVYRAAVREGNVLLISGQGPVQDGRLAFIGRVGDTATVEQGREAARLCMLNVLAQVQAAAPGGLAGVAQCLFVTVYVHATADFQEHASIADAATEILSTLWGPQRLPARSTVGVHSLPMGMMVEVDARFALQAGEGAA